MKREKSSSAKRILLLLILFMYSNLVYGQWEMAFRVVSGGSAVNRTVSLYVMENKNLRFITSGQTRGDFNGPWNGQGGYQINGACDIKYPYQGDDTPSPTLPYLNVSTLDGAEYYIRIENKFVKLTCPAYPATLGDFIIQYDVGSQTLGEIYSSAGNNVGVSSEYTWTPQTITLKNDFGGDRTNVAGNITFDDTTFSNVGYNGIQKIRDAITFDQTHVVTGQDNQYIANYYRQWRKFAEETGNSISVYLSSSNNYTRTATYARRYDITYQNYFNSSDNGGTIKLKGTSHDSPYSTNLYEDSTYNLEAVNTTHNNVYYTFDHWEFQGSSVGSSNPYNGYPPSGSGTLQAVFNHKPVNYYRYLYFNDTEYNHPVKLTWQKHNLDNSFVTQYAIWRIVKHNGVTGDPVQIGTVTATGATSYTFTDNDYLITNGYTDDLLHYDVRAYYAPNYSDPDYVAVYAQQFSIVQNNNSAMMVNAEKPTEYSISNYPNPFNPTTTINYQLAENGFVTLKVFDMLGKEVATLVSGNKSAGYYNVNFDASRLTSGVYIYTINVNGFAQSKKMLLMK